MSEQPGEFKIKDQCGHERSWVRIRGLSTGNEEWNKSIATEVDSDDLAKTQKKLEGARVRLAQQQR